MPLPNFPRKNATLAVVKILLNINVAKPGLGAGAFPKRGFNYLGSFTTLVTVRA